MKIFQRLAFVIELTFAAGFTFAAGGACLQTP
jgi:hypothetical protein